jgi:glycosyltransferase involved in cell wall biosynthesis
MQSRPTVFVYHGELLPYSATFIRTQAAALQSFKSWICGPLPKSPHLARSQSRLSSRSTYKDHSLSSRLKRNIFKRTGLGAQKFLKELSARSPALLHAHFALDASIALPITEQLGIPLITTLHGYDVTIRDEILSRSLEGRIYLKRRERSMGKVRSFFLQLRLHSRPRHRTRIPCGKAGDALFGSRSREVQLAAGSKKPKSHCLRGEADRKKRLLLPDSSGNFGCQRLSRSGACNHRRRALEK